MNKLIVSNKANNNFYEFLNGLNLNYIETLDNSNFNINYNDHPDLSVFYYKNNLYVEKSQVDYYSNFFENVVPINCLDNEKAECVLNMAYNNSYFFHNKKITDNLIFEVLSKDKNFINIKQGYSNCSMICFNNTIITSDSGVYKTLRNENINCYLVTTEGINLKGYKNGFIGGTCGFISENKLLFYGDVTKYRDYDIIKGVANEEKVEILFPKNVDFSDFGSIISVL